MPKIWHQRGKHNYDHDGPARRSLDAHGRGLLLLAPAVALVLLVAAANEGTLLLVAAHGRRRGMAVRATPGAGRARLARQMLTESTLLAAVGAAVGLALAPAVLRVLLMNYPGGLRVRTRLASI